MIETSIWKSGIETIVDDDKMKHMNNEKYMEEILDHKYFPIITKNIPQTVENIGMK